MSKDLNDRLREGTLPSDITTETVPMGALKRARLRLVDDDTGRKLPAPSDVHAESALLGALLWAGQFAADRLNVGMVTDLLSAPMFYTEAHRAIFGVLVAQHEGKTPTDPVTVNSAIVTRTQKTGSMDYLEKLVGDAMPTTETQLRGYASAVRDTWARRELIEHAHAVEVVAKSGETSAAEAIGQARSFLDELDRSVVVDVGIVSAKDAAKRVAALMMAGKSSGIATGFSGVDTFIGGMVAGETTIVGARTSVGKSAFAFQIVESTMDHNADAAALYVSLEMPASAFLVRAASAAARVDAHSFRQNAWAAGEQGRFNAALVTLAQKEIYFADSQTQTMQSISALVKKSAASAMRKGKRLEVVVIDHVLLIKTTNQRLQRNEALAEVSRWMKGMADYYKISVVGLSQVSRESEKQTKDKRPELHHLKYSGALEEDADNVILLHRDRLKSGGFSDEPAEVIVAKARNGRVGSFLMKVEPRFVRFSNLEDERMAAESRHWADGEEA